MRYTVTWHPMARDELAEIWLRTPDRRAIAESANLIDSKLGSNPDGQGEDFYGDRLLVQGKLAVTFTYSASDRIVRVLQVWHSVTGPRK